MLNRMQTLRWNTQVLIWWVGLSFGSVLFIGIGSQVANAQQVTNAAVPDGISSGTDPNQSQVEKAADVSATKPLTTRPDPRRVLVPDKTEPKTERQIASERRAREAARKNGEITFDDLKFDIEKGDDFKPEMLTKEIKELDKKNVKLRGFILPTSVFQQAGIKQFVLVRDNQECCFGPGAAIYDCVIIDMMPGKTTNFATRVVTVKGKFETDTTSYQYPDGGYYAIYKMTAEEVK